MSAEQGHPVKEDRETAGDDTPKEKGARKRAVKKVPRKGAVKQARRKASPGKDAPPSGSGPAIRVPAVTPDIDPEVPERFSTENDPGPDPPVETVSDRDVPEPPPAPPPGERTSSPREDPKGYRQKPYKPGQGRKGQPPPQRKPFGKQRREKPRRQPGKRPPKRREGPPMRAEWGELPTLGIYRSFNDLQSYLQSLPRPQGEALQLEDIWQQSFLELREWAQATYPIEGRSLPTRQSLVEAILEAAWEKGQSVHCRGIAEVLPDGNGLIVYGYDNYQVRPSSAFIPKVLMRRYTIRKGTLIEARLHPRRKTLPDDAVDQLKQTGREEESIDAIPDEVEEDLALEALSALFPETEFLQDVEAEEETCPFVLEVNRLMEGDPEANIEVTPFEDLVPYYPLERIILETENTVKWYHTAMRVVAGDTVAAIVAFAATWILALFAARTITHGPA